MMRDGELRLAFARIADVRKQLEEMRRAQDLSQMIDALQAQETATREAYWRVLEARRA